MSESRERRMERSLLPLTCVAIARLHFSDGYLVPFSASELTIALLRGFPDESSSSSNLISEIGFGELREGGKGCKGCWSHLEVAAAIDVKQQGVGDVSEAGETAGEGEGREA